MNTLKPPTVSLPRDGLASKLYYRQGNIKTLWVPRLQDADMRNRMQMIKMLCLTILPIVVLWGYSVVTLSDTITLKYSNDNIKQRLMESIKFSRLIHQLQKERDITLLYLSDIGSSTKMFLNIEYDKTDNSIENLKSWPNFSHDKGKVAVFETKQNFQKYITNHRQESGPSTDFFDELKFYSGIIDVFLIWLYDVIIDSELSVVWKSLVAYQKIISSKEDLGLERALGTLFYTMGKWPDMDTKDKYHYSLNTFKSQYSSARVYSNDVNFLDTYEDNITEIINYFRYDIQHHDENDNPYVDVPMAQSYFDNMTLSLNILLKIQEDLATVIVKKIDRILLEIMSQLFINLFLLILVITICPIVAMGIQKMTKGTQMYEKTLISKTNELKFEQHKTDTLLYQMVPKSIAEKLKRSKETEAEYFESVTILFSDISDFSKIISLMSPMEIVELLGALYISLDELLDRYDVYKVETINECYMVASGVPIRNDTAHALEIADFSLELLGFVKANPVYNDMYLKLRIGINTGPCMAGVVGTVMPRYCLYGDTVNTASRMKSCSSANSIQLSESTYQILFSSGKYKMKKRGSILVKGKGEMITFWLSGKYNGNESRWPGTSNEDVMSID